MQLNVIRLLADINVAVNKAEVVDMILPLFIESLEEGGASTPGLLRLRVCNLFLGSTYFLCEISLSLCLLILFHIFHFQTICALLVCRIVF